MNRLNTNFIVNDMNKIETIIQLSIINVHDRLNGA